MRHTCKPSLFRGVIIPLTFLLIFSSCQKEIQSVKGADQPFSAEGNSFGHLQQANTYSSEVARKWQELQLRIIKQPAGANPYGLFGVRNFAYCGIALYESVVGGMPSYQSLYGQLTDMPMMPVKEPGKQYHWPTVANAALAYMNRHFYNSTNAPSFQASMDSLENALNSTYQLEVNAETFQRSKNFGLLVATKIYNWSLTDGALTVYPPFIPPAPPLWSNTAPNPPGIFLPYWGNNRFFVQGSTAGTGSPLPPVYSTTPGSPYYLMAKEVYDVSQTLTPAQQATAIYFRDSPGYPSGAANIATFNQILNNENPQLDFYAVAQAKTGIAMAESQINCWKLKYTILQDRPIRYIRDVLGHTGWNPLLNTPPIPDFPSGHSQTSGAFAKMMTHLFGSNYSFTLHTYDYIGLPPRTYPSFEAMANDISLSRVYAGIHYTYSCVEGQKQGEKITANIINTLQFQKE